MQFAIIAHDGDDGEALDRRMAVRDQHVALSDQLLSSGNGLFGGAILDDSGRMVGTIKIVQFDTEDAFQRYMDSEPFVTGGVWKNIQVLPFKMGPSYRKLFTELTPKPHVSDEDSDEG